MSFYRHGSPPGPQWEEVRHSQAGTEGVYCSKCRQFVKLVNGVCSMCGQQPTRKSIWKIVLSAFAMVVLVLFLFSVLLFALETLL